MCITVGSFVTVNPCVAELDPLGTRRCCDVESTSLTSIQRHNKSCARWEIAKAMSIFK